MMISPRQIKAARAMLDWSQGYLATKAGVCMSTVRSLEMGYIPRNNTLQKIRKAFEDAGLAFTESDGVKLFDRQAKIFGGRYGCDQLFDDMLQAIKQKGGEVVAAFKSKEIMMQTCAMIGDGLGHLEEICKLASVKCLVTEPLAPTLLSQAFQFRVISKQHIGTISYFSYADRQVIIMPHGGVMPSFLVVNVNELAQAYNDDFLHLWDQAMPVVMMTDASPRYHASAL